VLVVHIGCLTLDLQDARAQANGDVARRAPVSIVMDDERPGTLGWPTRLLRSEGVEMWPAPLPLGADRVCSRHSLSALASSFFDILVRPGIFFFWARS
jgi:hypothetical protein